MTETSESADGSGPGLVVRGAWGLAALAGLAAVGFLAGGGALLYPYLRADLTLDRVVRGVALEWRDFGRDRALEKLQFEVDQARVPGVIGEDACALQESDGSRRVACEWAVQIALPGGRSVPLSFESVAEIDAAGELR